MKLVLIYKKLILLKAYLFDIVIFRGHLLKVWTIANQKGGVGKTTTTVALAGLLSELGHKVLVMDLDPHGSLTSYFGYDPDSLTLSSFQIFQDNDDFTPEYIKSLTVNTTVPGLTLLPTTPALATVERKMSGIDGMGLRISKALKKIDGFYDYVLLDCPPILGVLMINALVACNRIIIPVQTEYLALKGLERMKRTLSMIQKTRPNPLKTTIVPTLFDRRTQASISSLNILRKKYPDSLWSSVIPIDTKLRDSSLKGKIPSEYDPHSRATRSYRQLLNYIIDLEIHVDQQQFA